MRIGPIAQQFQPWLWWFRWFGRLGWLGWFRWFRRFWRIRWIRWIRWIGRDIYYFSADCNHFGLRLWQRYQQPCGDQLRFNLSGHIFGRNRGYSDCDGRGQRRILRMVRSMHRNIDMHCDHQCQYSGLSGI
jgi:hypothetical protein